jgi:uncharacterized membrane protein
MKQNRTLTDADVGKTPSLTLLVLGFFLIIFTWTFATIFLSVNSISEGFNITTTFAGMATGYFFGTLSSSMVRSDSSIKTFLKKPSQYSWLFFALFFQNFFSSISWVFWAVVCSIPTSDVTILTALIPLHLIIPFAFGICYLKERLDRTKVFGICLMVISAIVLSTDMKKIMFSNNNNNNNKDSDRMPLTSLLLYILCHLLWGFNYVSIGVYRKFHVSYKHMYRVDIILHFFSLCKIIISNIHIYAYFRQPNRPKRNTSAHFTAAQHLIF